MAQTTTNPTYWELAQQKAAEEAQARLKQQQQAARLQSMLQWAHQGNDAALAGNILGRLINNWWNHEKNDYKTALDAGADTSNNLYGKYRKFANKVVGGLFGHRKKQDAYTLSDGTKLDNNFGLSPWWTTNDNAAATQSSTNDFNNALVEKYLTKQLPDISAINLPQKEDVPPITNYTFVSPQLVPNSESVTEKAKRDLIEKMLYGG